MIGIDFLKSQITKSRNDDLTAPFLRHLIFQTVDTVAREHYPDDYSMKCAQVSGAIQHLLSHIGIRSTLIIGAACFAKVSPTKGFDGWTGFWGNDHHMWIQTEFHEIVDLSISQLHEHPRTVDKEVQIPAFWWDQRPGTAPLFKYLYDIQIDKIEMDEAPQATYMAFLAKVKDKFDDTVAASMDERIHFVPMLSTLTELNTLVTEGDSWASGALSILHNKILHPYWIREREKELSEYQAKGQHPPSRLSSQTHLFR